MFEFVSDRPVLDFVATVAERRTTHLEKLRTPADLARWVEQSALVDEPPAVDEDDLERARQVRDAAFGVIAALIEDRQPDPAELATVNAAAAGPRTVLRLEAEGRVRRTGDLTAVLAELATDCLDLAGSADRQVLHWCADPACTRPFVDRSRGQQRRWCGMRGCGDRAKAAAYRQRRAGSSAHPAP